MNDDRRLMMRRLRDEAMAVEIRLKERRRAQLMEKVQTILDKCVTLDELNVSKVEPSKYRLINEPLLRTPVKFNSSLSEPLKQPLPVTSYSLPSTPLFDEDSIEKLHKKFLSMKQECRDVSISESSAISTDLGPYMQNSSSDSSSSETSTPRVVSDTDISTSLDCSTPIKYQRVRRLSYTLEAPSPVLLKMMQNKATERENAVLNAVPKLNLSDDLFKDQANQENMLPPLSIQQSSSISLKTFKKSEETPSRNNQRNLSSKDTEDVLNGNSSEKQKTNISDRPLFESNKSTGERSRDSNGNSRRPQDAAKSGNLIEEFLMQQQKLMNELLEKQAKEQESLVHLFKEQEQQLVMQMQAQTAQQPATTTGNKSPACRSLQQSFDRSAKARNLFESAHLSALIRGYLTRRLLTTDRVQSIIQTIRDTTMCLKELNQGSMAILPSDVELHRRLLQQLNGAIHSFHEIFFEWDTNERMLVIARDREKKAGQMIVTGMPARLRPRSRSLSAATVKSLERKLTRQDSSRNSSRPSSASTAHPRTSPSSVASASSSMERKRSPSSTGSFSYYSAAQSNGKSSWALSTSLYTKQRNKYFSLLSLLTGSLHGKNKYRPAAKSRKPWRCWSTDLLLIWKNSVHVCVG